MEDWEALLEGRDSRALRDLADTAAARRLGEKLSRSEAEKALSSGDPEQVKALIGRILTTPEGRELARLISQLGGKP